jgi:hypothetical protein
VDPARRRRTSLSSGAGRPRRLDGLRAVRRRHPPVSRECPIAALPGSGLRARLINLGSTGVVLGVQGLCVFAPFVALSWRIAAISLGSYLLQVLGITAGYHRYFSHRAFKTSRFFQFVLA